MFTCASEPPVLGRLIIDALSVHHLLFVPLLVPHAHLLSLACSDPRQYRYRKNTTLAFACSSPRFRLLDPYQVTDVIYKHHLSLDPRHES